MKICFNKKPILFLATILAIALGGCEQKIEVTEYGGIEGTVVNAKDLNPVEGVSISTNPPTNAILTDSEGKFTIEEVAIGDYTVTAKKNGFRTTNVDISVKKSQVTSFTISMETSDGSGSNNQIISNPEPANGSADQSRNLTLRWSATNSNNSFDLSYDVYLYKSNTTSSKVIAQDITDTFVDVEDLDFNTTYFWQVTAKDNGVEIENSPVWTFTTEPFPDNKFRFAREVDGSYEIFASVFDTSGQGIIQLTDNAAGANVYPRLNPQRNLIAFTSNRTLDFHIYTMTRQGENVEQITSIPVAGNHNNGVGYCWSPDGGKLLYSNYENLYAMDRNGTDRQLVATAPQGRHFRMVDWTSQNGGRIIAQTIGTHIYDSELYIMEEDGSNMKMLIANYDGRLESPSFSIDGKRVMYTWDKNGLNSESGRQIDSRIYTMNLDSTDVQDVSINKPNGTNDLFPRYSPDGAHIIFMNTSNTGLGDPAIYIMDLNGENREKLFDMATMPDWF